MEPKSKSFPYRLLIFFGVQIMLLTLAFAGGYFLRDRAVEDRDAFPVFEQALDILKAHALLDLPENRKLEYGMIQGLLQAVGDPYTMFIEPPQHELQSDQLTGKFGGIGAHIEIDETGFPRLYPFQDSPARKAGIADGDRLLAVDDWQVAPQTPLDEIQAAIRGPVGEAVRLLIFRPEENRELSFVIDRSEVTIPSVTWNRLEEFPQVGIVHVNIIAATTRDEVTRAVEDLQAQGVSSFILDLRNNYGGLVDGGVDTARLFLKQGDVIAQQYRGQPVETFAVTRPGPFADLPLVVLVNHGTASASEIIAGALQAQGRAVLIGEPTYGKNTIQLVFNLQDGSSLHVTSARWWIPNLAFPGESHGLTPDISVSPEQSSDSAVIQIAADELIDLPATDTLP